MLIFKSGKIVLNKETQNNLLAKAWAYEMKVGTLLVNNVFSGYQNQHIFLHFLVLYMILKIFVDHIGTFWNFKAKFTRNYIYLKMYFINVT